MMLLFDVDYLSEMSIFMVYVFYIQAFISIFILRKRNAGIERKYSVPLYPVIPIVAIAGSTFVVFSTLITQFSDCLYAILLTLVGLPVYAFLQRKRKHAGTKAS